MLQTMVLFASNSQKGPILEIEIVTSVKMFIIEIFLRAELRQLQTKVLDKLNYLLLRHENMGFSCCCFIGFSREVFSFARKMFLLLNHITYVHEFISNRYPTDATDFVLRN